MYLRTGAPRPEFLVGNSARVESIDAHQVGPLSTPARITRVLTALPTNKWGPVQLSRTEAVGAHALVVDTANSLVGKSNQTFVHRLLYATKS